MGEKRAYVSSYRRNNVGDDLFVFILCKRYPNVHLYIGKTQNNSSSLNALPNLHQSRLYRLCELSLRLEALIEGKGIRVCKLITRTIQLVYKRVNSHLINIAGSAFIQLHKNYKTLYFLRMNYPSIFEKIYYVGANFGPYIDESYRLAYENYFKNHVVDMCFRDEYSKNLFPNCPNVRWAPDVVFTLDKSFFGERPQPIKQVFISILDMAMQHRPQNVREMAEVYERKIADLCEFFNSQQYNVVLSAFCVYEGDLRAAQRIHNQCTERGLQNVRICAYTGDLSEVLSELDKSSHVIATRFHAMILGWIYEKPTFSIIYNQKMQTVLDSFEITTGFCPFNDIPTLSTDVVWQFLSNPFIPDCAPYAKEAEKQFQALDAVFLPQDGSN